MLGRSFIVGAAFAGALAAQSGTVDEWVRQPVDDRTFRSFLGFFAYDHRLPFDAKVLGTVDSAGVRTERMSFQSTPGARVTALFFQPLPIASTRRPAIVFLHGGSKRGKDTPGYAAFAEYFARAGFRVLSIDLPYFGERATGLLTSFTEEEKHEKLYNEKATYLAWVTQIVKDAGRSIDFLAAERQTDSAKVVLMGFSRGAQLALVVGGAESRFRGVASIYGGHFDHLETGHQAAACPANYIGHVSPRPLFTMNGRNDADFSRDSTVLPLHKLAKMPVQHVWLETGHTLPPDDQRAVIISWLQGVLK
jgi:dienelactone hydrolase